eukprot:1185781-Prorocentrum_minimum.AAC.13
MRAAYIRTKLTKLGVFFARVIHTKATHSSQHKSYIMLRGPLTSFYGSSCADNGKDALNTPETLLLSRVT